MQKKKIDAGWYDVPLDHKRTRDDKPKTSYDQIFGADLQKEIVDYDDGLTIPHQRKTIKISDVTLKDEPLGKGAIGVVYKCEVNGYSCVIKIPKSVASEIKDNKLPSIRCYEYEETQALETEWTCYERISEPHEYLRWRDQNKSKDLPVSELKKFYELYKNLCQHPGHSHIIHMFHFENSPYPMLFSEMCDTTLQRQADDGIFQNTDSLEWQNPSKQILDAFNYMITQGIVHDDISPYNVLVQLSKDSDKKHRYVLTDFDRCAFIRADSTQDDKAFIISTCGANLLARTLINIITSKDVREPFNSILQRLLKGTKTSVFEDLKDLERLLNVTASATQHTEHALDSQRISSIENIMQSLHTRLNVLESHIQ